MDVPVDITTVWTGPDGSKLTSAASPVAVMKSFTHYTSKLTLNYVESADSGNYTCTVSIKDKIRASVNKEITISKLSRIVSTWFKNNYLHYYYYYYIFYTAGDGMFQIRLINADVCQPCFKSATVRESS